MASLDFHHPSVTCQSRFQRRKETWDYQIHDSRACYHHKLTDEDRHNLWRSMEPQEIQVAIQIYKTTRTDICKRRSGPLRRQHLVGMFEELRQHLLMHAYPG